MLPTICHDAGLDADDVQHVVLHQANRRILEAAFESLGFRSSQAVVNIERVGNTSAASIPLALEEVASAGRVARGDVVLLCGFGAGLTWGTVLLRW